MKTKLIQHYFCLAALLFVASCSALLAADADLASSIVIEQLSRSPADKAKLSELKSSISGISDADEKCRAFTIYCLGCLANGQLKEGLAARSYLQAKFKANINKKYISDSYICSPCRKCNGTGNTPLDCRKCQGEGTCNYCGGAGNKTLPALGGGTRTIKCPKCSGRAKCKACAGEGHHKMRCSQCNAMGVFLDKGKIGNVYQALLSKDKDKLESLIAEVEGEKTVVESEEEK